MLKEVCLCAKTHNETESGKLLPLLNVHTESRWKLKKDHCWQVQYFIWKLHSIKLTFKWVHAQSSVFQELMYVYASYWSQYRWKHILVVGSEHEYWWGIHGLASLIIRLAFAAILQYCFVREPRVIPSSNSDFDTETLNTDNLLFLQSA